ncbi:MAG: F0F1 ATP synthase subunit epsilon [Defluviitaleaceae bacterium]|nr:F0F1 ATP synthase subunit epsilon [Defluviitaleaceae bacterium]
MSEIIGGKNKKLRLKIVTPTKLVFDADVDRVTLQTIDGQMGVLVGHAPVTTVLGFGSLRAYNDENIEQFTVFGGFCEINQQGATVLADVAEHPSEIDAERAKQARERAERRIKERNADMDEKRAKAALRKALVRLDLSGIPTITEENAKK